MRKQPLFYERNKEEEKRKMYRANTASPCMTCSQKRHSDKLDRLRMIQAYLDMSVPFTATQREIRSYDWDIHEHCRYGLSCNELRNMENQAQQIAHMIEKNFAEMLSWRAETTYRQVLSMMQGYFPRAYRELETEWNKNKKGEGNE